MITRRLALVLVACAAASTLWAARPIFVGHRGCDIGVENTEAAYRAAVDYYGYAGLECDVRVTADNAYVISHDETTERVGGHLTVAQATLAELQAEVYHQQRRGATYTGHLCTVAEYLDICNEKGVFPIIELKWANGINNNDMSNFPGLAALIEAKGMTQKAIILTSMKKSLEYIRTNFPQLNCQWLCNANWKGNEQWCATWKLKPSSSIGSFDAQTVATFNALGLDMACWCVDTQEDYERVGRMGVYMMTCNYLRPWECSDLPTPTR